MVTKIIINRKSEWMNRARGFKFFIDNVEIGKIKNGSSEEYHVKPGIHTVECKIDWCSSSRLDLVLNAGEVKFLKVKSGMKYFTMGYILLLLAIVSDFLLNLAGIPKPEHMGWIKGAVIALVGLYLVYYLTLGRKKYLLLEEDKENIFS